MKTADEIYQQMTEEYEERSGRSLNGDCDMAVRMYAAAAQIEALYAYGEWVKGQSFPQTATGEYLDGHGKMRGLTRISAVKATGTIRFSIAEALSYDVTVASGTVCLTAGGEYFETTATGTIAAGSTYCDAAAKARTAGANGNVAAGTVIYMAEAPVGISACTNTASFSGGADEESDESFRQRILESYRKLPNGANAAYYEKVAQGVEGVGAVKVIPKNRGLGTVDIIVTGNSGMPATSVVNAVTAALNSTREICVDIQVSAPTSVSVNVSADIDIEDGYTFASVKSAVESAITAYFNGKLLGQDVLRAKLGNIIYGVKGVKNYTITAPAADISIDGDELPVKGTVTIGAWS